MTQDVHQRARELAMDARMDGISTADRQWLETHVNDCGDCARFSDSLNQAIGAVHMPLVTADAKLVRATQVRVRNRALQLKANAATMRPLWIAAVLVCAWATVTTPLLWAAFAWLGTALSLSNAEWRTGFLFAWIAPTLAASLLLLGTDSNRARWRKVLVPASEGA